MVARPGSLVRAVTAYLVGIEMGVAEEAARAVACGIEYLHTASLVFDDLPAMDDARTRRGAPCPHVVHGEAVAMLEQLRRETGFRLLVAHEETGTGVTYARDRRVRRWAREAGIEDFIFVTSRGKSALSDYFDDAPELAP